MLQEQEGAPPGASGGEPSPVTPSLQTREGEDACCAKLTVCGHFLRRPYTATRSCRRLPLTDLTVEVKEGARGCPLTLRHPY